MRTGWSILKSQTLWNRTNWDEAEAWSTLLGSVSLPGSLKTVIYTQSVYTSQGTTTYLNYWQWLSSSRVRTEHMHLKAVPSAVLTLHHGNAGLPPSHFRYRREVTWGNHRIAFCMQNLWSAISSTIMIDPWTKQEYLSCSLLMEHVNITEAGGKVSCNLTHKLHSEFFGDGRYFLAKVQHYNTITNTINGLSYGMLF